mgnify:CR=1 FL=1
MSNGADTKRSASIKSGLSGMDTSPRIGKNTGNGCRSGTYDHVYESGNI